MSNLGPRLGYSQAKVGKSFIVVPWTLSAIRTPATVNSRPNRCKGCGQTRIFRAITTVRADHRHLNCTPYKQVDDSDVQRADSITLRQIPNVRFCAGWAWSIQLSGRPGVRFDAIRASRGAKLVSNAVDADIRFANHGSNCRTRRSKFGVAIVDAAGSPQPKIDVCGKRFDDSARATHYSVLARRWRATAGGTHRHGNGEVWRRSSCSAHCRSVCRTTAWPRLGCHASATFSARAANRSG